MKTKHIPALIIFLGLAASSVRTSRADSARTIEITVNDQMKFSVTKIEAKPGEKIRVELKDIGTMPKEVMGHNWVLLKAGADAASYATAAMSAQKEGYQPKALENQVISSIPLIGAKQTKEVIFDVPTVPGTYVYLCTFPAHFMAGMKGELFVK